VNIRLPDLGEGTKEATIKEILVKVGQRVEEYEDLCEVFTDKLVAKIPSTASGIVKSIHFENDTICAVGHPIMTIEEDEGAESSAATTKAPVAEAPKSEALKAQKSAAASCPLATLASG